MREKRQATVFHTAKAANSFLQFLKNETKHFSFVEYVFSARDEDFCFWITGGGLQNVWTKFSIFKCIVLSLVIYSVLGTILKQFGHAGILTGFIKKPVQKLMQSY